MLWSWKKKTPSINSLDVLPPLCVDSVFAADENGPFRLRRANSYSKQSSPYTVPRKHAFLKNPHLTSHHAWTITYD
ncbi:hypothetical protein [Neobacillus vireti]|uniref:hypothetical protein n=1 Tax=Neobacillus vireti TaxID=220686 RepID=UPI0012E31592|nr:hypothetical protein [Neobacillus vireti]